MSMPHGGNDRPPASLPSVPVDHLTALADAQHARALTERHRRDAEAAHAQRRHDRCQAVEAAFTAVRRHIRAIADDEFFEAWADLFIRLGRVIEANADVVPQHPDQLQSEGNDARAFAVLTLKIAMIGDRSAVLRQLRRVTERHDTVQANDMLRCGLRDMVMREPFIPSPRTPLLNNPISSKIVSDSPLGQLGGFADDRLAAAQQCWSEARSRPCSEVPPLIEPDPAIFLELVASQLSRLRVLCDAVKLAGSSTNDFENACAILIRWSSWRERTSWFEVSFTDDAELRAADEADDSELGRLWGALQNAWITLVSFGPSGQDQGAEAVPATARSTPAVVGLGDLTDRQRALIEAMAENKITALSRKQNKAEIVKAVNRKHDPTSYARDMAALVKRGLLGSKEGPNGGYWLTQIGQNVAQSLKDDG